MREAAWPLIRRDLGLDYAAIGLLISLPYLVATLVEPLLALLGDTGLRRRLILLGGVAFTLEVLATAVAPGFWFLFLATALLAPFSGSFVTLSQATLMDIHSDDRDRAMAWWAFTGSVGVVVGPLVLAAGIGLGVGWRPVLAAFAIATPPLIWLASRVRFPVAAAGRSLGSASRDAFRRLRSASVIRWLVLLELTDLLGDVLLGFVALYFVDVAGTGLVTGAVAVTVLGLAGLAGDAALVPLLRRMDGTVVLRVTAAAALIAYPAFLLAPAVPAKLVLLALTGLLRTGWYAIPQARLFDEFHGASGAAVAIGNAGGLVGLAIPLGLGLLAQRIGLGPAMWVLLAAPIALLVGVPPRRP